MATVTTTLVSTLSSTATTTEVISSGVSTAPGGPTTTTYTTATSTTTITVASGAPTGTPYYIQVSPEPNPGAGWALSDPATHMTDNYNKPAGREVFELTASGQLYSVSNNAWYGTITGQTSGKLFWDTRSQYANTTFTGTAMNDGTGRVQLFLKSSTKATTNCVFCVSNTNTTDQNAATGFHINFAPTGTAQSALGNCTLTNLYLSPIANGRIAQGARLRWDD